MSEPDLALGLDLGGTKILGVVVDPSPDGGEPIVVDKVHTPYGNAVLDALGELANDLMVKAVAETGRSVRAVGLGAPGLVDISGTFRYGPNLPGVVGVPIGTELQTRVQVPVVVENDAACAAWSEQQRGAARGFHNVVVVALGTGIGGGMTIAGELMRGAHGFAAEFGHFVVDPAGPPCPCGRNGCWERFASGNGLAWLARQAVADGQSSAFVDLAGGVEEIRGEHVAKAARAGDQLALGVFESFADYLASGIVSLINILDPDVVVIAGGVSKDADLFIDQTLQSVGEQAVGGQHRGRVPVVAAHMGERAGAIGAALIAAQRA